MGLRETKRRADEDLKKKIRLINNQVLYKNKYLLCINLKKIITENSIRICNYTKKLAIASDNKHGARTPGPRK